MQILLDVEPCRHAQSHSGRHSRAPTDKGNFRVELLSRAIRTLKVGFELSSYVGMTEMDACECVGVGWDGGRGPRRLILEPLRRARGKWPRGGVAP